jgi:hypothetical protein
VCPLCVRREGFFIASDVEQFDIEE